MRIFSIVLWLLLVTLLASSINGQDKSDEKNAIIVGRVVDGNGRPVPFADITYNWGIGTDADGEGRFELVPPRSSHTEIWITSRIDREWLQLITPRVNLFSEYMISPVIKLGDRGEQRHVNLGDVQVQAYYSPIKILVGPEWRKKVFFTTDWIGFRITDSKIFVASESEGPIGLRGINAKESSITLALPEGEWKIEMRTEKMTWKVVAERLRITRDTPVKINWPQ